MLIASAGSLEDLGELIAKFYGGELKYLGKLTDDTWQVSNAKGDALTGVRVVQVKKRFRFEMI